MDGDALASLDEARIPDDMNLPGGLNDQVQHLPIRYGIAMTHCYRHRTAEDRAAIMMMRATHSIRTIVTHLGRAPSTVSRKLA